MDNYNYRQPDYMAMRTPIARPMPGSQTYDSYQPNNACPEDMYTGVDKLPIAMGYVPVQQMTETFDLCKALQMGTIFPELCKPFCGKRGVR